MDLFEPEVQQGPATRPPLAARMRPRTLDEFAGQGHIIGPGKLLRRAIQADQLSSLIFYGPPGTGKTTLARIIAGTTKATFHSINAVLAGVKDIRESIVLAQEARQKRNQKFILFVDEVHRFNKSQQDALLPHVENGTLILIGATTENPYFEVNKALISRSRVFQLRSLNDGDIEALLQNALADPSRGYGEYNINFESEALSHLVAVAGGDARAALNALELAVEPEIAKGGEIHITLEVAEESIQKKAVLYDKDGDAHYDIISAFIKSVRGSDPDAALFWMAKMVYAGEDPRFIFRRMLILASEDVGLADPKALGVVEAAARAFDYVGMPEGRFHLAQACLYLATAPKSNTTLAFFDALKEVEAKGRHEVPIHLQDASRDGEALGHGQGYQYPHAHKDHWVAQQYLPEDLRGKSFYQPSDQGYEKSLGEAVPRRKELQLAALLAPAPDREFPPTGSRGVEDYWLRRSLNSTQGAFRQIRDIMYSSLPPAPETLALDLSGGKGFLTWEACRRFSLGGVWSVCENEKSLARMREFTSSFSFAYRPTLTTLAGAGGDLSREFGEGAPAFGLGLGFFADKEEWEAAQPLVAEFIEKYLDPAGQMVLALIDPQYHHPLSQVLRMCRGEEELIQKVAEIEESLGAGEKQSSGFVWDLPGRGEARLWQNETHTLQLERKLKPAQVEGWLSGPGPSRRTLDALEAQLGAEGFGRFRSKITSGLANITTSWTQRLRVARIRKG